MRLPSLKYLRTFQVSGKHLSFKDASKELSITASAVSHQIRNLETFLGVQLFHRLTRSLEFTDAGQKYYAFLDLMFSRLETETQQLWSEYGREIVRLCVPPFFASEALLPKLSSFQSVSPKTDIRVTAQPSAMRVHPAEADLSILLGQIETPGLKTHALFAHRSVVACSPAFLESRKIESYKDLNGQTLIVHDNRPNSWKEWASRVGVDAPVPGNVLRSDSMSAIARAAQQGLGIALISWPLSRAWFLDNSLVKVFDEEIETGEKFQVAYRQEDVDRISVAALRDWIIENFESYT